MGDSFKTAGKNAGDQAKAGAEKLGAAAQAGADQMRDAATQAQGQFQEKFAEPARRAGEAMKASGEKLVEGGSTIGTKMIDQAEQNARDAFAAMREAAGAKDISEVMKIQGEYLREQGNRSVAQAREIGELIMQFGREAVAPLKGGQ